MVEPDAVPAGGDERTPATPGGAGAPPAGTKTRCEELADGRGRPVWRFAEKRGPAPEKCRTGAPRGAHPETGAHAARRVTTTEALRGAPVPLLLKEGRKDRPSRAAQTTGPAERWLFEN
jgi:hypothetical protein